MRTILLSLLLSLAACGDNIGPDCSDDPEDVLKHGIPACTDAGTPTLSQECLDKLAGRVPASASLCETALDEHGVLDYTVYTAWIEANVADGQCAPVACELPDARCFFEDACNPAGE